MEVLGLAMLIFSIILVIKQIDGSSSSVTYGKSESTHGVLVTFTSEMAEDCALHCTGHTECVGFVFHVTDGICDLLEDSYDGSIAPRTVWLRGKKLI